MRVAVLYRVAAVLLLLFAVGHTLRFRVFYLFAAILAWQLGGLPSETLALMRGIGMAFALCFAAITVVSWRYLFILPRRAFYSYGGRLGFDSSVRVVQPSLKLNF
jgi:hypothetical protein